MFLEGSMESSETTDYTNLAVLVKCNDDKEICNFFKRYYEDFCGLPVKQRLVDYINGKINNIDLESTVSLITLLWKYQNCGGALSQKIITSMIKSILLVIK